MAQMVIIYLSLLLLNA